MIASKNKKLNKEQLQAIHHKTGPLLVIAGAGTGKTTVITERVKYLIEKKLAKPEEILALTFTEKAAREMEERIDVALPYGYTNMWVMTFHSFCERVLRQNALHIGLDPRFKLTNEAETTQLIRENLFKFKLNYFRPLGNPYKFIGGMIQHFSRLQDEEISPADYISWVISKYSNKQINKLSKEERQEKEKYTELASAYKTYEDLKIQNSLMDFGDLITKTLKLFRDRPNILKVYQKQFKYILIDEFQDTNYAQNELALRLVRLSSPRARSGQANITVVGDDDQSVYRFRGAAVSNIIQFRKNFPKAKVVVLTKNYRSTQEILDKSYALIQNNNPDRLEVVEKIDKRLVSLTRSRSRDVNFIHSTRVENEADEVVKEIIKLSKKYDYKDFAILVRANNHAEPFVRALARHGIPYQFLGPGRLFKQSEIIDLISYLKVLYNFEDNVSFYKILTLVAFGVDGRDIAKLGIVARKNNLSLFETAEKIGDLNITEDSQEKIQRIVAMVHKHLGLISRESAGQILYYFLEESGTLKDLVNPETKDAETKANNISKFFDKIKTFETDHTDANLFKVVDWLNLSTELGESPLATDTDWAESNSVNILTVHSAKGLEFPVVFLVNLVSQRFPTTERHEQIPIPEELIKEILPIGDYHIEEERRLFYVGMTRAKDKLYLTAANYYGEGKRDKKLSSFISEALGDSKSQFSKSNFQIKNSFLDYEKTKQKDVQNLKKLKINYLSYSQIEAFKVCPLHYKLRYILKIPTEATASLSFGNSIHNALKNYFEGNDKDVLKLLKQNWIKEGYLSREQEEEFLKKGKKFLKEYLEKYPPKLSKTVALEESFVIPISHDLKMGGKIDRVDELSDGVIEIIDYKTGASPVVGVNNKEIEKNLQLSIYAMAAVELFNKKPEDVKLSLYYFETQTKISTTRNESQLMKAKEDILKLRDEIENSDFKCSHGFLCQNCEFKLFCEADY